jgi:hypothetical protein
MTSARTATNVKTSSQRFGTIRARFYQDNLDDDADSWLGQF